MTSFNPQDFLVETKTEGRKSSKDFPVPEEGQQLGIVSLIVDLGIQKRPDFIQENGEPKPQTPARQFAVFVDLPESVVDYGGEIGHKPYRLRTFGYSKEGLKAWNFTACYPSDMNGKPNFDGLQTFHANSPFRKLAKATGDEQIFTTQENNMDISQLLGRYCMVDVEVKEWSANGKSGTDVKYKGATKLNPKHISKLFPDGLPELESEALLITFDNATADNVKFIHSDLKRKIKEATNYEGSQMQRAFVEAGIDDSPAVSNELNANEPRNIGPDFEDNYDDDIPF